MVDFVDQMEKLALDIYYRKQQHRVFSETIPINQTKNRTQKAVEFVKEILTIMILNFWITVISVGISGPGS